MCALTIGQDGVILGSCDTHIGETFSIMGPWSGPIYAYAFDGEGMWSKPHYPGGWSLKMLAFDSTGTPWCVGKKSDVGKWSGTWPNSGSWCLELAMGHDLEMLAFGGSTTTWCIKNDSKVGFWQGGLNESGSWYDEGYMAGWVFKMIAFDHTGTMWCIGSGGNLGELTHPSPEVWHWRDHGAPHGASLNWLAFDTNGTMWCTDDRGNIFMWVNGTWTSMGNIGMQPLAVVFNSTTQTTWCVTHSNQIVGAQDRSQRLTGQGQIRPNKTLTIPLNPDAAGEYYLSASPFPPVVTGRKRDSANGKLNVGSDR